MPEPRPLDRRQLLRTGAVVLGGAGAGWTSASALAPVLAGSESTATAASSATTGSSSPPAGKSIVPFHGAHQAGVATPAQAQLSLLGLDLVKGTERDDLARLMTLLSDDAWRLSQGTAALADNEPELAENPASLSITFGFGPRVMTELLGMPGIVEPLPAFATDQLDDAWGQTDLAVQICADDPLTLAHARRMLLKDSAAFAKLRWVQDGFRTAYGIASPGTTPRNVMGQLDGTVNPTEAEPEFAGLIWSTGAGFTGGTTMVVRRIRALLDTWDKVDRTSREAVVGRRLDTGAPLTGASEFDEADFEATDDLGLPVIDPASHIARAHHRTPQERFLRRVYNYTVPDATQATGEDSGLVFIAFAADLGTQFVPVQQRLAELDRLNEWVTTIGSAVYAILPGAPEDGYVGQGVLEA